MNLLQQLGNRRRHFIVYLFPPLLIIVNYFVFSLFISVNGLKEGYLSGMIFYWLVFCIIPVLLWIKKPNRKLLFKIKKLNWWQIILLIIPVGLAFAFGPFKSRIADATPVIIILSLIYAIINAFCEEFLWRGLYFDHHPANFFYAVIVPSFWFGIWHYVPLSVQASNIGNFYFILSAMGLGFCWAAVTYYTRSVFWSFISHVVVDFSGLGILYYFS
jgi:membrane protease YdiL (CAAX protease family)